MNTKAFAVVALASLSCGGAQGKECDPTTIVVNGKPVSFSDQLFWAGYSGVTFLPATAAPIGLTADGLPVGVQIVGPQYGDYTTIAFAKLLEKEYRSFVPPPAYQ